MCKVHTISYYQQNLFYISTESYLETETVGLVSEDSEMPILDTFVESVPEAISPAIWLKR